MKAFIFFLLSADYSFIYLSYLALCFFLPIFVFLKHFKLHAKRLPLSLKCATQIKFSHLVLSSCFVHIFDLISSFLSFIPYLFSCNFTIETSVFTSCLPFRKPLFILESAGV